jgi:hypothetical protein
MENVRRLPTCHVVASMILLDRHAALRARLRYLLDFLLRLFIFGIQSLTYCLKFFTSLVLVPIGLTGNTMLMFAFLTTKYGLICTARVHLSGFADGGETVSEVRVCGKSCSDARLIIPISSFVSRAIGLSRPAWYTWQSSRHLSCP